MTKADIDAMPVDEMHDECRRLIDHLKAEREAQEQAHAAAQQRAKQGSRGAAHSGYKPH